ncbi:TPA: hypothetical protein SB288_001442 [Campylobacter coli]|nr:hypothetical protein [Campylobacter coli]
MNNILLNLTYEKNARNNMLKTVHKPRHYYNELLHCIDCWRNNGGSLKNIDILVCTDDTTLKLPFDNIKYLYVNFDNSLSDYGFVNIYKAGQVATNNYPNFTHIHIDLDMYVLRDPSEILLFRGNTALGVYSIEDENYQRKKIFGTRLAETDLIITKPGSNFYNLYLKEFNKIAKILRARNTSEYDIEEYVADWMLFKNEYDVIEEYEYGESFKCKPVNPLFLHHHKYYN